jgi:hypothetical protein
MRMQNAGTQAKEQPSLLKRKSFATTALFSCLFFGSLATLIVSNFAAKLKPEMNSSFVNKEPEKDNNILPNSSQYTWMGNHFIPPKGVPTYSPADYLSYFSRRNTLFIGDSTARRAYGTLFAAMTSNNLENIPTIEMGQNNSINNKGAKDRCIIKERLLFESFGYWCRNLSVDHPQGPHHLNNTYFVGEGNKTIRTGKFDFLWSPCMRHFATFEATSIQKDYDLVVVALGIWDSLDVKHTIEECRMTVTRLNETDGTNFNVTLSNEEKYDIPLDALSSASSPDLQVVFRTPGK